MTSEERTLLDKGAEHAALANVAYIDDLKALSEKTDNYVKTLQDPNKAGMSAQQAQDFSGRYEIVDQVNSPTGMSATIFKNKETGEVTVSVRGTEPTSGKDLGADAILARGVPASENPQYVALDKQIQSWTNAGVLPSQFEIDGHSLGGYLGAAYADNHPNTVTHTYIFNAPGQGGLDANIFGSPAPLNPNITLYTTAGTVSGGSVLVSPVTDLGYLWGATVVEIPTDKNASHSIIPLANALYKYSQDGDFSQINVIEYPTSWQPPSENLYEKLRNEQFDESWDEAIKKFNSDGSGDSESTEKSNNSDKTNFGTEGRETSIQDAIENAGWSVFQKEDGTFIISPLLADAASGEGWTDSSFILDPNDPASVANAEKRLGISLTSDSNADVNTSHGITWDNIDLAIQQYFTALNVTQSIEALGNALKHGDTVAQLNALANLALRTYP